VDKLIRLVAEYGRGKDFERKKVTRVTYMQDDEEVTVEGDDILTHRFPVAYDLLVCAEDGQSTVSHQGLRAVSVFSEPDAEP
jgi:hypothetical protein